jgi:3-hydroxyacyl-CoA dehydrogenase
MPDRPLVKVTRDDDVAVLTLQHPPVNTLFRPLRAALLAALDAAEADPSVSALVLTGERHFSAGAELGEFDSGDGLAEPTLHLTLTGRLDSSPLPSVAAITGAALGGGLELALACTARVTHPRASIGLPETTLGFMPGAGGTQRLPRAAGIEAALGMIVSGDPVDGEEAARLGIADEVSDDPQTAAIGLARRLARSESRPRLRDRELEPRAAGFVDLALRDARRAKLGAGRIAALEALLAAATEPFDTGLAHELRLFEHLAGTAEARAARYRFLSERGGRSIGDVDLPEVVSVIGAGTMGRGIAQSFLAGGFRTILIDTEQDRVDAGVASIAESLESAVGKGRLTRAQQDERLALLTGAVGLDAAADAGLVVEAVFEDLAVKRDVFAALDRIVPAGAVLASNTSSLDLDAIAAATRRPQDFVGMHFFSPAHVMRLVEVIEGAKTSPRALGVALAVAARLRKLPVVAKVGPGFIGNRIFDAYLRQASLQLAEGVRPERIDAALEAWGMAMGPFRVLDIVGNDVPRAARAARGETDPAWAIPDLLAESGDLGRKTGAGWYRYSGKDPEPNPRALALLPPESTVPDDEIASRCIDAMVAEAARVLGDGIAADPRDIDTVLVHGYGFPARRGGPWFAAAESGWPVVAARLERRRAATGDRFWDVSRLLRTLTGAAS